LQLGDVHLRATGLITGATNDLSLAIGQNDGRITANIEARGERRVGFDLG
jgi:hypothetical protein